MNECIVCISIDASYKLLIVYIVNCSPNLISRLERMEFQLTGEKSIQIIYYLYILSPDECSWTPLTQH